MRGLPLALLGLSHAGADLVQVEQFGMAQCPWASTLTTTIFEECLARGNVGGIINFTLNMVGGKNGGANYTKGDDSFHGSQEITAEKYQLCARQLDPGHGIPNWQWLNFTSWCGPAAFIASRVPLPTAHSTGPPPPPPPQTPTPPPSSRNVTLPSCPLRARSLNGFKGLAICTYYGPHQIDEHARKCAASTGFEWAALSICVNGTQGTALYEASATYTSDEIAAGRVKKYGTFGKDDGIPIVKIAGIECDGRRTLRV